MSDWPWVLVPAVVTALVVRIDAKVIGPYFALSSLIGATEGLEARDWYDEAPLRSALIRRFIYPVVLGFALGWTAMDDWDIVATGSLAAALLLWPAVFEGLPWSAARRSWHLPVLYLSFVVGYGALTLGGERMQELLVFAADGDIRLWLADQLVGTAGVWVVALIAVPVFRATFIQVRTESDHRRELGAERSIGERSSSWGELSDE